MLKNSLLMYNFTHIQLLDIIFGLLLLFLDNYENLAIATTTAPTVTPPPHRGAARQMYGSGSLRPPGSNPAVFNQNQRKSNRKITPSPSTITPQLGYQVPISHYPPIFRLPIHVQDFDGISFGYPDFIRDTLMRPPYRGSRVRSGGIYGQRLEYHEGKPKPLYDIDMYKGRGYSTVHHFPNYMEDPGLNIDGIEDTYDGCNVDCEEFLCRRDCICISRSLRCDGTPDCIGSEDELDCEEIQNANCEESENTIKCPMSAKCIPKNYICDGDDDCGDFSDETHCGSQVNCTVDQFQCNNGLCIPESWLCDTDNDCIDFSDELNCTKTTCSEDEFSCTDGTCISKNFKCDRRFDCPDKSDEEECDIEPAKCNEGEFQCAYEKCIKVEFKCDGDNDCGDWSDENDCDNLRRSCDSGEFRCNNGKCIPKRWRCDKQFDCDDKDDEANCDSNIKRSCAPDEFICNNGECILKTWVCDGSPDCDDGEDEGKCEIVCDDAKFGCTGPGINDTSIKFCINKKHVCDGKRDCPKGDDEKSCPVPRECEKDSNCTQLCVTTYDKKNACSCFRGYNLATNGISCEDVNECLYATDPVCSQTCTNTIGSFNCGCMTGYVLRPDLHTCKALGAPPTLLFANRMDIRQVSLSNHQYTSILRGLHNAIALDYHYNENLIFWSDVTLDIIKRAYLNGTETTGRYGMFRSTDKMKLHLMFQPTRNYATTGFPSHFTDVIKWGLEAPSGIAVDWIHDLLFWTDSGTRRIEVATIDGKQRAIITADDVDKPRAIAVHPGKALVFWTDWGPRPKIEKAEMDGRNRKSIVTETLFWPNGLTIDYTSNRIYWADAKHSVIETSQFDGTDRRKVLTRGLPHPFALTIFEDAIYWTDWHTKSISTANKATGAGLRTIHSNLHFPMDIHSFHPQRQPNFKNHCGSNNGGCSHLCLPNAESYSCVCKMGLKLNWDGKTCQSPRKMLIFARKRDIRIKHIDNSGDGHYFVIPVDGVKSAVALDWDSRSEYIFWTDVGKNTINTARWNGSDHEVLISTNLISPAGLAFDWLTNKLYWTDSVTLRIEVSNMDGTIRSLLIWNNLDKPRDIVLDPLHGYMYWSDYGEIPKIERAHMDGKFRTTIISQNLTWPNGLAIDHDTNKIYWTDGGTKSISFSNLDGSDRRILIEGADLPHPFGVDVYENHIYWTDWKSSNIERVNKNGKNRTLIVAGLNNIMDIKIFHKNRKYVQTPCNKNNGGCSHLCLLTPTNYTCVCPIGVLKKSDGKTCEDGPKHSLILAHRMDIRQISLDINYVIDVVLPFKQLKHVTSADVDRKTGEIYWTDSSEDVIQKSRSDGNVRTIMWHELQMAEAIAIDSSGRKIYWTDGGRNSIEVAELSGRNRKLLIWEDVDTPRALVLHYQNGIMFWSDWGTSPRIELAHMDGTNRVPIITENLIWPNGLAIDKENAKLYWNDAKISVIQCSDFNGKNRVTVTKDVSHPYGLVVVGNYIYWTDWLTKALHRADKRNGNNKIDLVSNLEGLMDIRYTKNEDVEENVCGVNNGGCSHLCLRNPKSYVCACPTGIQLIKENTCGYQPSNYILFTSRSEIVRISLDTDEMWDVTLPIRNVYHGIGIDFHWNKNLIFYSDREKNKIVSVNMKNMSDTINVITTNISAPNGIAVDWLADNLYWTDSNNKLIEVSKINGMHRKVVISEYLDDPRSIAAFPRKGYLFWTDWGTNPKIERSSLNGSDRRILISNDLEYPNGIVIDFKVKRLYWSDAKLDRIETSDLYGRNRIQLIHGTTTSKQPTHPFDLAIYGDYVYWTDWYQKQIYRADKSSGKHMKAIKSNLEGAMGVTIVSEARQSGWNPCAIDNGGCTHLCFYNSKNYTCECPDLPTEEPCKTEPLEGLIIKPPQNYEYENELEYEDDINQVDKINYDDKLEHSDSVNNTHFYIITLIPMCAIILISILIVVAAIHYRKGKKKFLYENGKSVMTFSNPNYYTSNNEQSNQPAGSNDKKPFLWKRLKYDKSQERVYEEKADNASPEVVSLIPAVLTPCSSNCEAVTPEIERSPSVTPLHRIDAIQPVV